MKIPFIANIVLVSLLLFGCEPELEFPAEVMGLRPVYGKAADLEVRKLPPRELCRPGKIYIYGPYLFINEVHKGIHVINNSDPSKPQPLAFLQITGNVDMAVKDGFLYADHLTSLVVLDIREPENVKFVKAVEQTFGIGNGLYPPERNTYFECVDPSKGPVIGWAEALLQNPDCFR